MSKQLTLLQCCTNTGDETKSVSDSQSLEGNSKIFDAVLPSGQPNTCLPQENTIFAENPVSSSTTIIINDRWLFLSLILLKTVLNLKM